MASCAQLTIASRSAAPGVKRYKVEILQEESEPPTTTSSPPPPSSHLPPPSSGPDTSPGYPYYSSTGYNHQPHQQQPSALFSAYSPSAHSHSSPEGDGSSYNRPSPEDAKRALERAEKLALFGSGRARFTPRREVFERNLDVFFATLGSQFPFLSKAAILSQHRANSLPALLANSICALAARFDPPSSSTGQNAAAHGTPSGTSTSSGPAAEPKPPHAAALPFEEQAKKLLVEVLSFPSVDTCVCLILLAWNEFGSGRDSGLWMFSGMAIRIVQDLGLQHEATPFQIPSALERARRRLVFWSVFFLDRVISYGTGRRVTIPEGEIDISEPSQADCALFLPTQGAENRPPHPFPALIAVTRFRGRISDLLNQVGGQSEGGHEVGWVTQRKEEMERLQEDMIGYYQAMPKDLHFSVQSFKLYKEMEWSPPFLMLHMLFHSVITVLHRPSLLQNFAEGEQVLVEPNVEVSRSSARTLSNMVSYADLVGPIALLGNPFADQAIFISAIAFLDEKTSLSSAQRRALPGLSMTSTHNGLASGGGDGLKTPTSHRLLRSFADSKLDVSISALQNIISHWAGVGWVLRTIEQKKRGYSLEEMDPDVDADTPSVLIPKDPMLMKTWLAREWRNGRTDGGAGHDGLAAAGADDPNAGALGGAGGGGWTAEGWDENMLAMLPSDIGISFTGENLDPSHLNLSFEPLSHHFASDDTPFPSSGAHPASAAAFAANGSHGAPPAGAAYGGMDLDFAMSSSDFPSPSFFRDVLLGGGGGGGGGGGFGEAGEFGGS